MANVIEQRRQVVLRPFAALLVALLTPVCVTLALGGADWIVTEGISVSWYGAWLAWPMLLASGLIAAGRTPGSGWRADCLLLGLLAFAVACGILWSGGGRLAFVSFRSPDRMAWLGLILVLPGLFSRSPGGARARPRGLRVAVLVLPALALGIALQAGLMGADARRLEERIEQAAEAGRVGPARSEGSRPDVVWILVDTLRADALGIYRELDRARAAIAGAEGAAPEPARTPFLDSLAARGILYQRAIAPAPWTLPSMMGVFTARYPSTLDPEGRGRVRRADDLIALSPNIESWIGRFREAGYHTAGFQKNPFLGPGSGFERDFDVYRAVGGDRAERASAAQLVRSVHRWADVMARHRSAGRDTPYLLYVHFMDPHIDYRPPASWLSSAARAYRGSADGSAGGLHRAIASGRPLAAEDRDQLRRLYAGEVAYLDAQIEALVEGLRERGLLAERTLIALSADHGEQFAEHGGWEHGDLWLENVRVPMLLAGAGLAPRRVRETVSAIDLGPTVLAAAGLPALVGAEGRSVLDAGRSRADSPDRAAVVSEYGEAIRIEAGSWLALIGPDASIALYDVASDPGERVDLAAGQPEQVAEMRRILARHRTRDRLVPVAEERSLDARTAESLRAIGYGD